MPIGPLEARAARPASLLLAFALCFVASLAEAHEDPAGQITALTQEIAHSSSPATLLWRRAELRRAEGDWRGALADYDQASALDPGLEGLDFGRGAAWLEGGEAARAEDALDRFLARRPESAEARWLRGRARVAQGKLAGGLAEFDAVLPGLKRITPEHYLERARIQTDGRAIAGLEDGIRALGPAPALVSALDALGGGGLASNFESPALIRVEAPPRAQAEQLLVARGSAWKYDAMGIDRGTAWRDPPYDDSTWPSGPAPLGFGDPFIVTPVPYGPDPANKYTTTYFRRTFALAQDPALFSALALRANYDDGFVLYLNGVEIARRGLPAGTVLYSTFAANHEGGAYETINVTAFKGLLVTGANSLAIEVHQQAPTSSDLAMDVELAATQPDVPGLTRGPYLQVGTPTSVVVRWRTDLAASSRVDFGTDLSLALGSVQDPALTTEHELAITGLEPSTRYFYRVAADTLILAGGDSSCAFVTAPAAGISTPTRVWVVGDSGLPGPNANAVRNAYAAFTGPRDTNLWLMLGDNAYQAGTDAEFQAAVFDQYPAMLRKSVLWPTRGNHEVLATEPAKDYYDFFTMPIAGEAGGVPSGNEAYYSFDYGRAHFICLDSEGTARDSTGAMLQWLESDLAAEDADWVIAYWHHPPYTKGSHNSDDPLDSGGRMRDMREQALPILEAWGVDLVLSGHSHSYERSYLLDGHYGLSGTFDDSMKVDSGDGRPDGSGPYEKPSLGVAPHEGAVYAVAGSSSQTSGGTLDHPAMFVSLNVLGSLVLDIADNRLDALFLDAAGAHRDSFAIVKGTGVSAESPPRHVGLHLAAGFPNPSRELTRVAYDLPRAGRVVLDVFDLRGRRLASLASREEPAGPHEVIWNGRDRDGRRAPPGAYFVRLRFDGESRVSRLVRID